jgi:hypothetical protein
MRKAQIPVFIALLSLLFGAASAVSVLDNTLSFANVSVSPNPVVAGSNVIIRFQLFNSYDSWLYGMNLQPSGSYPILNFSPQSSRHLSIIGQGLNATYINYTFSIPNTTPSGTYTILFTATYEALASTGEVVGTSNLPISFFVHNRPIIKLLFSNPQPASLYEGYNQTVQLEVENTGYGTARNVSVSISPLQGTNLLSSVTNFFISNLTQGQAVYEPLLVSATNTTSAGIAAEVSYYPSNYQKRISGTQVLQLALAPAAQFRIASQGTALGVGTTDVPVTLMVMNSGTSDATQVQISLETSYPITPVASTAFIPSLQAGATTNVTFLVSVDSQGVSGNYPVTMYEQWKQPNGAVNQQFSGSNNYFISISSGGSSGTLIVVVVIIIIAAIVVYFYRMRKKQKAKQKK